MSMRSTGFAALALAFAALALAPRAASAEGANLGRPVDAADIAPWDISIMPDGTGLPPGSGTAAQGAKLFAEQCSACHGDNAKGSEFGAALVGGPSRANLDGGKTIRNYWPYATTLFDYIRRAMPYTQPNSLTSEEVYALTAYILALNQLIGEKDAMTAETLPQVRMPNRDNFITRFPDRI
ncbi:MAG: S-disulfanyl-L-cysteine oxidoreductase SoxD [Bradyrhizobium sp.]|nr:S-disulfanyl-L-cysteine oxidoreductase SoxD [Bradyrhizobium sp.]